MLKNPNTAQTQALGRSYAQVREYILLLHVPNSPQFQDQIKCLHQTWNQAPRDPGQVLRSLRK